MIPRKEGRNVRQVGHMVIPHRIVQAERFIAVSPVITHSFILLDDEGLDTEHLQTGRDLQPTLATTDDEHSGLALLTFALHLLLTSACPQTVVGSGIAQSANPLGVIEETFEVGVDDMCLPVLC